MADDVLLGKIQDLSDLEIATLLCLINQEHCIIDTEPGAIEDLTQELSLIASNVFGLSHAIVDCSEHTTHDDLANSLLTDIAIRPRSPLRTRQDSYFSKSAAFRPLSRSPLSESFADKRKIANVVIAKNLDNAPKQVQIQALELVKTRRTFTHTSMQNAPKPFLLIALTSTGEGPRLTTHLNDHMFISHFHDPDDGFPNLDELDDDGDSISSVVKKKTTNEKQDAATNPILTATDVEMLAHLSDEVMVSVDITRYMHDIIAFLRLHRAVEGGISPLATRQFEKLVKSLAPLQGLYYATPSLVSLAAKKIYSHRIQIVTPERDRSMQWGSDLHAVEAALEDFGPDEVIDDVLSSVEIPV
ncbi:MAG: hypothetical protein M1818_003441 [Claussenomyces sp. TS43310]|nr:MAG: hypothetical protein M1818_003441 [Claussenomyces sp. TS43310]